MKPITELIVHCTATRADWWAEKTTSAKVAEIRRWHMEPEPSGRGWKDIGYHYLIDRDGSIAIGRNIAITGAHVKGHNEGTVGISLFGGYGSSETDEFAEHFTAAQDRALRGLIAELRSRFGAVKISGHNEYAAKACPGFDVREWFAAGTNLTSGVAPKPQLTRPYLGPKPRLDWFSWIRKIIAAIFGARK